MLQKIPEWLANSDRVWSWASDHFTLLAAAVLLLAVLRLGWQRTSDRTRRRTVARKDLAAKIGPLIGQTDGARFVTLPKDTAEPGATVVIMYPRSWPALDTQTAPIRELISHAAGGDWEAQHDHAAHQLRYVRKAAKPELPTFLEYTADAAAPVDVVPFAVDAQGKAVTAELTTLTPHVLISASTGWGKTSTVSVFVAHTAERGALVDICDPKQIGYLEAFDNLPNVRIHTEVEQMAGCVAEFRADMESRYRLMKTGADISDRKKFPLRLLVLDEMGSLVAMLAEQWADVKPRGGPARPPTYGSVLRILWQGRAAGFHVITAAQQANAQVLINSDARDQYALKVAAGPQSVGSSRMMFGDERVPAVEQRKGRAVVGIGPQLSEVQLAHLEASKAREMASRGPLSFDAYYRTLPGGSSLTAPGQAPPAPAVLERAPSAAEPVTLNKPARMGRPPSEDRPPVTLTCAGCDHSWQSRAASGTGGRCPQCGRSKRVPKRAATTPPPAPAADPAPQEATG